MKTPEANSRGEKTDSPEATELCGSERLTGLVKWFDPKKGFGFITRDDGGEDLFVHHSDVDMKGFRQLNDGERVEFEVGQGKKGPKAVLVRVI